jgi:hypothetical protein
VRQEDMGMTSAGPGSKNDSVGKGQQQFTWPTNRSQPELSRMEILWRVLVIGGCNQAMSTWRYSRQGRLEMCCSYL